MNAERNEGMAGRIGSAVCTRCGYVHRRMPLDHLGEFMCSVPTPGTEIPGKRKCGGSLEPKRRSPNAEVSGPPADETNNPSGRRDR